MVWVRERTIPAERPHDIKTELREIGWAGMERIVMVQDKNRTKDLVKMVMNLRAP
jgi:hypothetical protein